MSATTRFNFSIDGDVSGLDEVFCLAATAYDLCQLKKLVETNGGQILVCVRVHEAGGFLIRLLGFKACDQWVVITDVSFGLGNLVVDVTMFGICFVTPDDQVFGGAD